MNMRFKDGFKDNCDWKFDKLETEVSRIYTPGAEPRIYIAILEAKHGRTKQEMLVTRHIYFPTGTRFVYGNKTYEITEIEQASTIATYHLFREIKSEGMI